MSDFCRKLATVAVASLSLVLGSRSLQADELKPKVIAEGLDNPCGVAIQPGSGDVFVSMNGKVVRFVADGDTYKPHDEIVDFASEFYGKGPKYNIGPLGLLFLNPTTLVVGGGEFVDGKEVIRVYEVGSEPAETPMNVGDARFVIGPLEAGSDSVHGEGNYFGLAELGDQIFVTCNGDDTKGWVSTIDLGDNKPGPITPKIKTKVATGVDAPTPVTASPKGDLVVGQLGEVNVPTDSLLTFYDPKTGKLLEKYKTGLYDLTGLAYNPADGKLYGVDFAWMAPEKGGLFALPIEGETVKPTKLATIDKPSAMAFTADGKLFITSIGKPADNASGMDGKLLMFEVPAK